jgi:hypothetical protein
MALNPSEKDRSSLFHHLSFIKGLSLKVTKVLASGLTFQFDSSTFLSVALHAFGHRFSMSDR